MKLWEIKADIIKKLSQKYGEFWNIKDKDSCVFVLSHRGYNEEKGRLIKEEVVEVEEDRIIVKVSADVYEDDNGKIMICVHLYTAEITVRLGGIQVKKKES